MPKATRTDRTRLIVRYGHSLHFGLSAPPTASQASDHGVDDFRSQRLERAQEIDTSICLFCGLGVRVSKLEETELGRETSYRKVQVAA
jgi:hypothetical protein